MSTNVIRKRLLPAGFTEHPTTVLEALIITRAAVQEEGRWIKACWFENPHQEEDPGDPFCNNWNACLQGIVNLVTVGAKFRTFGWDQETPIDPDFSNGHWAFQDYFSINERTAESVVQEQLYEDTCKAVSTAIQSVENLTFEPSIPNANDNPNTTRDDVVAWLDKAIHNVQQPFQAEAEGNAPMAGTAVTS